jgi:hypothetical protein
VDHGQAAGPVPAFEGQPITVSGSDGQGFCPGPAAERGLSFPGCSAGETAVITADLVMTFAG